MSDVENELRSRVDGFVNELSALIRRQALQAVEEVLKKGDSHAHAPAHRGPGRPRKIPVDVAAAPAARAKPGRPSKASAAAAAKRKAGEKRTPQQLGQITEQVFNYVKSNAGQGVEQIAKSLATSTKELTLPIRKLLADKKIGSKGQKRATRYFPR
jgi:DNA-binding NtrC family response regulator